MTRKINTNKPIPPMSDSNDASEGSAPTTTHIACITIRKKQDLNARPIYSQQPSPFFNPGFQPMSPAPGFKKPSNVDPMNPSTPYGPINQYPPPPPHWAQNAAMKEEILKQVYIEFKLPTHTIIDPEEEKFKILNEYTLKIIAVAPYIHQVAMFDVELLKVTPREEIFLNK